VYRASASDQFAEFIESSRGAVDPEDPPESLLKHDIRLSERNICVSALSLKVLERH
jgi:hypothetical protein